MRLRQPQPAPSAPSAPATELVPVGEVLKPIRQLEAELATTMHEAGAWRGRFEQQQRLLEDRGERQRTTDAELDRLRRELERRRLPWGLWWLRG